MLREVFSDYYAQKKNYLTEIDARIKMFFVFIAIFIAISSARFYVPAVIASLSFAFLLNIRVPLKIILFRLAMPLSIATVVLIIQILFYGYEKGLTVGLLIMSRVVGAVSLIIFLSMTTPVNRLLGAARWFKVPYTWIEIAMFTYRYIFVLLEDIIVIRDAQKVRLGHSTLARSLKSLGELAGAVVIRAYDQSISTYEAMMVRGYDGKMKNIHCMEKFGLKEAFTTIVFMLILVLLIFM